MPNPPKLSPPPANFGIFIDPPPARPSTLGLSFPILSIPLLSAIVVPTVAATSNPAPKSFPFLPPKNFANFPAFPTPALARRPAAAAASLSPPFIRIEDNVPTNLPIPVPNLKYSAKRVGQ